MTTATTIAAGTCETQQIAESVFGQNGIQSVACNPPETSANVVALGPQYPTANGIDQRVGTVVVALERLRERWSARVGGPSESETARPPVRPFRRPTRPSASDGAWSTPPERLLGHAVWTVCDRQPHAPRRVEREHRTERADLLRQSRQRERRRLVEPHERLRERRLLCDGISRESDDAGGAERRARVEQRERIVDEPVASVHLRWPLRDVALERRRHQHAVSRAVRLTSIPANAILDSLALTVKWKSTVNSTKYTLGAQAVTGAAYTAMGLELTKPSSLVTETTDTLTVPAATLLAFTAADFTDSSFKIKLRFTRANGSVTASTASIDFVRVAVTYHLASTTSSIAFGSFAVNSVPSGGSIQMTAQVKWKADVVNPNVTLGMQVYKEWGTAYQATIGSEVTRIPIAANTDYVDSTAVLTPAPGDLINSLFKVKIRVTRTAVSRTPTSPPRSTTFAFR